MPSLPSARAAARRMLAVLALTAALLAGLPGSPAEAADKRVIPLSNLRDGAPEITLHGEEEAAGLRVFVPPMGPLSSVVLTLSYENGIDILPEKGALSVYINGSPVAELPLSAFRGPVNAAITLPASLIRPGENQILFQSNAQHRAICTVRGTFDLWARVNLAASSLALSSETALPEPDLAMVRRLLASSDRAREPLTILKAGGEIDADQLGWGAMVAQAYGLLLGDLAPRVAALPLPARTAGGGAAGADGLASLALPGGKNVLIGTRDQLAPVLGDARTQGVTGPFLGVYPAGPAGGFVVVLSGRTATEVDQAVMRFADLGRPLPPVAATVVADPGPVQPPSPREVQEEGRYRLSDLGFATVRHSGYRYTGRFTVTLPSGFAPVGDRPILFHVNAAFEGNLGPGAVLNVRVNGRSASAMEVDKRSSGIIENGEMQLPMALFRPGPNIVEVEAELPPAGGTDCVFAVRRPSFTLHDSSSIEIPGFARLATMPNLGTLAQTAFPYGGRAGRDAVPPFDLVVVGKEPSWFAAAWTMTARLAQRSGELMRLVPYVGWDGTPDGNALIVGPVAALPQSAFASAPLPADRLAALLEAGSLVAQASARGEPMAPAERRQLVERLRSVWTGSAPGRPGAVRAMAGAATAAAPAPADGGMQGRWQRIAGDKEQAASAWMPDWLRRGMAMAARQINRWTVTEAPVDVMALTENAETLPEAALLQYKSPGVEATTWTLLTASDSRAVERAMRGLGEGGLWDRLRGGGGLWSSAAPTMTTLDASRPYQVILDPFDVGNLILILARNLSQRIELLFALLLGTAMILTISMRMLLKRGHAERSGS
ncbi:cellulose biosynthesis cyclic di-GMP-binding regulatory protein BcsB [Azospirillum thermophilum]|nr:cellulose biosynthesis cyclic di-GMP-binding regulatory protein BcsB [Azospirillum thermophilum]